MSRRLPRARSLAALTLPLNALLVVAAPARAADVEHVFLFCIDGVRASEGFDAPGGGHLAPLLEELAPLGSLLTRVENRGLTTTLPAHQVYVTGHYADYDTMPPNGDRRYLTPRTPTLFESFRQQTGAEADSCWVVSNTPHLYDTHRSLAPGYGEPYEAQRQVSLDGSASDPWVWEQIDEVMADHTVSLMLVNLHETDRKAHSEEWGAYTGAMGFAAEDLVAFWDRLQADPDYAERTALLVVTDHGRHLDGVAEGWIEHGDECQGCRKTFLLAVGPGIREDWVSDGAASLVDVAPTVAHLMGIDLPHARGRVLTGLLDDSGVPGRGGDAGTVLLGTGGALVRALERFDPHLDDGSGAHSVVVERSDDGGETWADLELPGGDRLQHAPHLWSDGEVILAGVLEFEPEGDPWRTTLYRWSPESGSWDTVLSEEMVGSSTPRGGLALIQMDEEMLLLENNPRERRIRVWVTEDLGRTWFPDPQRGYAYDTRRFPRDLSALRTEDGSLLVVFSANVAYQADTHGPHDNTEVYRVRSTDGGQTWSEDLAISNGDEPSIQPRITLTGDGTVHAVWADLAGGSFQIRHATSPDHGESWSDPVDLTGAAVGAWEPALASDGTRPWLTWTQSEGPESASIRMAAIHDGALVDPRELRTADGAARTSALAYLDDGSAMACWTEVEGSGDWETRCTTETVAWYPALSAHGSLDPSEVDAGGPITGLTLLVDVEMGETSVGFDRVSVEAPSPFEPAAGLRVQVDGLDPDGASWTSGSTLWFQLAEPITEPVALRIEASVLPPPDATGPFPVSVGLHNGDDPYVTPVDGDLTLAAVEAPGDCGCRVSDRSGGAVTAFFLACLVLARRRS